MIRLIRAELLKILTTRLWWGLLIGVVLGSAAICGLIAWATGQDMQGQPGPGVDDPAMVRMVYTQGTGIARLITLAFGIIAMSGEFRHQTITSTVLAAPRRWRIVLAKLVVVALAGLGYGVAAVASGVLVAAPVMVARGGEARLTSDGIPRALLLSVVATGLWAVIGLGIGTLLRNQIVALLVSIGIAWILEPIIVLVVDQVGWGSVARFFPSAATSAVTTPPVASGGLTSTYLPWWGGVLVLLGYALFSGAFGAALTLRRDIT